MLNHAFILSAHTNFEQIKLLLSTLHFGDVFIHVDKKSEELYQKLKVEYSNAQNIYFVQNRTSVNWSGFSQVDATLKLLKLVKSVNKKYDYIHFISGQDLLLMTEKELNDFLIRNGTDKLYLEVNSIGQYSWRLKLYYFFRENPKNRNITYRILDNIIRLIQRPFIHRSELKGYDLYKGSQWFSITNDCLNYILESINETDFLNKFKFTACPDEHFFQILLMNSKFKDKVMHSNARYIVFEDNKSSPKVLKLEDLKYFMNGQYMFARKFDLNIDEKVINNIISKNKM